jgi:microcystin-dependent protein
MMTWPIETPPSGWLERNGASLLRATYADLFAVIGTIYGAADSSHFNLPDHRGRFPRYWDHAKGNDPDRATRTVVPATGATMTAGDHVGTEQLDQTASHHHLQTGHDGTGDTMWGAFLNANAGNGVAHAIADYTDYVGGNENRSKNDYEMPIIKY